MDRLLADGGAHAAGVENIGHAIDHEGVAASVRAADSEAGARCRNDSSVRRVGDVVHVHDAWCQQRQGEVVSAVDGKILDADRIDMIGLLRSVGLDGRPL